MQNPDAQENNQATSIAGFRPISTVLNSLPISGLKTSNDTPTNSSTTGKGVANLVQTGKPPSAIVLDKLRNIAQSVNNGQLMDDQEFKTSLLQHFGPSRFASNAKLKHIYGDDYDCQVSNYEITLDALHDGEMKLYDAVEFLNRPAAYDLVAKQLAKVRVVMARRGESKDDLTILIDTYAEHLMEFPPDIVVAACKKIIDDGKWFPLVSQIRAEMQSMVRFRRAVWTKFQELRNPLLAKKAEERRLAADPRLNQHWKSIPKKDWLPQHFEWAVEEVQKMLDLARQNPTMLNVPMWEEELAKLKNEQSARVSAA